MKPVNDPIYGGEPGLRKKFPNGNALSWLENRTLSFGG